MQSAHIPVDIDSRSRGRELGSIMIAADQNCRNLALLHQTVKLLAGNSHDAVGRSDGMKQVAGMNTEIGLDFDNPVDRFDKTIDNVELSKRQPGFVAARIRFSGPQMAVGQMAEP